MDRPSGSSGFDRSEMIPPVPAPRYKRKLITNEDSKYSSNKQNTCMSEQTTEILPPPRRKHKSHLVNKTNALTYINNIKNEIEKTSLQKSTSTIKEIQIIINGEQSPTSSNKCVLEIEKRDLNRDNYLNLDEQKCSKTSGMTDAFSEIVGSSILENFINNRVLDIPLGNTEKSSFICAEQTSSTQVSDADHGKKNRVNSSLTENSATIVGVFYKPEYSSLKLVNGNNLASSNINTELDSTVWSGSFVNDGNMKKIAPQNESVGINIHLNKKDSEEDDSGVYFSDTKSPPHRANDSEITNKNTNDEIDTSSDFQFFEPFTSNDRDTFDNNSSELGPNMYNEVLDSFEAQTVNALREEVTDRLSLCSELSKNKAVENWLDNGDYSSKKKVINSNFSEYLRNMLEVEESERSLSPYPLSTVDESSDVSEKGAIDETEFVGQSYTLDAQTVPSNLSETRENRNLVCSDVYLSSFVDTNSVNNVNNECTEVTQCKTKSISALENPKGSVKDFETFSYDGQLRMLSENNTSQYELFFKETSHPESISPSIEHGAVNQLITFFETIHTEKGLDQENESVYEDDINEATQDEDVIEQDSPLCYDTLSTVDKSQNEIKSNDHNAESIVAIGHEEQFSSSVVEVNTDKEETLGNQYLEEENIDVENTIFANGTYKLELETFTKFNNLEPGTNKTNCEINLINYSCLQPVELVEKGFSSPIELKIVNFEDAITTYSTEVKNEQNIKFQRNTCLKLCDDGISQFDQDIEELRPPMDFADDKELPELLDINKMTEIKNKVPNFNISTKDLLENDETLCPYKPTRIPIVILTEADVKSVPIGSVELHPLESLSNDDSKGVVNNCEEEESLLENAVTVILEKNWGSIGLKIKGDANGVVVSDILAGGAADESGLVFQGLLSTEKNQEQIYCLKSASF